MYSVGLMLSMDDYWMYSMSMNRHSQEDQPRAIAPSARSTTTKLIDNVVDFDDSKSSFSIVA